MLSLFKFAPERALLDRVAVDRIRSIAQGFTNGEMKSVFLKIAHKDLGSSKTLAINRLASVKDLLVSFGVDQYAIITEVLVNDTQGDDALVRVSYGM